MTSSRIHDCICPKQRRAKHLPGRTNFHLREQVSLVGINERVRRVGRRKDAIT